ncbi:MAG: MBL fold metallo-hydrolase [Alphaproteobacteria bacterium]|nr:MBL fold metallo-hydrolase [Alphaproteobacteria bacterium]
MLLKCVPVKDVLDVNSYFYINEKTKRGFLIDPGAEPNTLIEIIKTNNWIIEKILLTHGHFDHIGAVEKISATLNIPYFIHLNGARYLLDCDFNLSVIYCGHEIVLKDANYFHDGDILSTDDLKLRVIHTPGHTSDSVIFYDADNNIAFSGDTIFRGAVGTVDVPGGDREFLRHSIVNRIFSLPDNTILYPGHSESTDIFTEKKRYGII